MRPTPQVLASPAGIWFTHDLDWAGLALAALPALVGSSESDPRRRELAGRRFRPDHPLLIVHDPNRITGRAASNGVRVCPSPSGRRQHAKFVLLLFEGHGSACYRAAVTSANLTYGGLTNNRELIVDEESKKHGGPLFASLLSAIDELIATHLDGTETVAQLASARDLFRLGDDAPASVLHSWGPEQSILRQLSTVPSTHAADRVTVLDPGFARGPEPDLVAQLRRTFPSASTVRVVAPKAATSSAAVFSAELVARLRHTFDTVDLFAIDLQPKVGQRARPLHAKALGWDGPGGHGVLAGSANFTDRGLCGDNLELSAVTGTKPDRLLADLGVPLIPVTAIRTRSDDDSEGAPPPVIEATATVAQHRRDIGTLDVRLTLRSDAPWPTRPRWRVHDAAGPLDEGRWRQRKNGTICRNIVAELDDSNWVIELVRDERRCAVPVVVVGYDPGQESNDDTDTSVDDPFTPTLNRFQQILASRRGSTAKSTSAGGRQVDVLMQSDTSIVHVLTRAALEARRTAPLITSEEVVAVLESSDLEGRLSEGERWAVRAIVENPSSADTLGRRVHKLAGGLR